MSGPGKGQGDLDTVELRAKHWRIFLRNTHAFTAMRRFQSFISLSLSLYGILRDCFVEFCIIAVLAYIDLTVPGCAMPVEHLLRHHRLKMRATCFIC